MKEEYFISTRAVLPFTSFRVKISDYSREFYSHRCTFYKGFVFIGPCNLQIRYIGYTVYVYRTEFSTLSDFD